MKINMLVRVRRLFNNDFASRLTNRYNQRAWIRSIRTLGGRWLLATPITRSDDPCGYSSDTTVRLSTLDSTRYSPVPIERLPDASKYRLQILRCDNPCTWYADKIGQTVPYVGHWPEGFKSREDAGYINIVQFADAKIVKLVSLT